MSNADRNELTHTITGRTECSVCHSQTRDISRLDWGESFPRRHTQVLRRRRRRWPCSVFLSRVLPPMSAGTQGEGKKSDGFLLSRLFQPHGWLCGRAEAISFSFSFFSFYLRLALLRCCGAAGKRSPSRAHQFLQGNRGCASGLTTRNCTDLACPNPDSHPRIRTMQPLTPGSTKQPAWVWSVPFPSRRPAAGCPPGQYRG